MAGDWIKLQKDTFDKPEVLAIATRMDIDPDAVVGKLCRIWAWFDTHTTHGNASCVTFSFVDRYVGVTGFAEQVALVGWLAQDGHDLRLPNFDYHNGETSKTRALGKNRAEKARSNARSNAPCVTKSLPEKRREEKSSNTPIPPKGADAGAFPEKQKTPAIALPYSAGNAEVKKSELFNKFVFSALTAPPVVPTEAKWLGLLVFMPSILQSTPVGEFPLITISFLLSSGALTPAKFAANLAGSLRPPAYLFTSSIEKVLLLTLDNLLILPALLFAFIKTSPK